MTRIRAYDFKVIWIPQNQVFDGDDFIREEIKGVTINNSSEGERLQNNTYNFDVKLTRLGTKTIFIDNRRLELHQLQNEETGEIKIKKGDLIKVYLRYINTGDEQQQVDINTEDDLIGVYSILSYNISTNNDSISITAEDITKRIFNRLSNGRYGLRKSGPGENLSIEGNQIASADFDFKPNELVYSTFQYSINQREYSYLILSNTSGSITVHRNLIHTSIPNYLIGESAISTLYKIIQQYSNSFNNDGRYTINVTPITELESNYNGGVQFLRPDNTAFPILQEITNSKPLYQLINQLTKREQISTNFELINQQFVFHRDLTFTLDFISINQEGTNFQLNIFYQEAPLIRLSTNITNIIDNTITIENSPPENLINDILRVNGRTYQILNQDGNNLTLNTTEGLQLGISINIIHNVQFVFESSNDFRQIINYNLGLIQEQRANQIHFSAGINNWNQSTINNTYSDPSLVIEGPSEKGVLYRDIASNIELAILKLNPELKTENGSYVYPSYPYTFPIIESVQGITTVNSNTEFNRAFRRIATTIAEGRARALVQTNQSTLVSGSIRLRFNKFLRVGLNNNFNSKFYSRSSIILFKDIKMGWINPNNESGFYTLSITGLSHQISSNEAISNIQVKEVILTEQELQNLLN